MNKNKFFMGLGALAAMALAACSNDEPVNSEIGANGDGSTAYMTVSIKATNSTRASSGDSDFESSTTENYVDNANFYFYTKDGIYVTAAQVWDGGNNKTGNIEFEGKTVLVLKDLNEAKAPNYIVTVLNAPEGFTPGQTLAEMEAKLSLTTGNDNGYAYTKDGKNYFTMSTSSYIRTTTANYYEYFTTKITDESFLKYTYGQTPSETELASLKPVSIYVERLAAKVGVDLTSTNPTNVIEVGGKKYFKLTVSGGNTTNTGSGTTIGGFQVADKNYYVAIEGWGLTNLNQNSYMMKNIKYTDTDNWHNGTSGSAATLFRNYWAKAADIYGSDDASNSILARYALNDFITGTVDNPTFKLGVGAFDYCFENTNNVTTLTKGNLGKLATSALIFARVYEYDGTTMTPASLVSYNGIMFSPADFKAIILNTLQTSFKYAYKTDSGYAQIGSADIEFINGEATNKGEVTFALTTEAATRTWYTYNGATLPTNDADYSASSADAINTALGNAVKNTLLTGEAKAYMYNGGMMYYNVPIEHYRTATPNLNDLKEGDYGVVRNHVYKLTINSLTKLGKAIYDPTNVIIPDTPTDEDRYALGVKVNILSWKIVSQGVDL